MEVVTEWDGRDRVGLIPDTNLPRLRIFAPAPLEEGKNACTTKSTEYDGTSDCCHLARNSRVSSFIAPSKRISIGP